MLLKNFANSTIVISGAVVLGMVIYGFIVDDASVAKEYILNNPRTLSFNKVEVSTLTATGDANIGGLTLGKGGGDIATNTVFGRKALFLNTVGIHNSAVGYDALYSNTSGESNVAMGQSALYFNTTGKYNTAIGGTSLYNNKTGSYNAAVGASTLFKNITGSYNTAINHDALHLNVTGSGNTAIGYHSLYNNIKGSENVAIGFSAGAGGKTDTNVNISGTQNTWIGYESGPGTPLQLNNSIAIGYQAKNTQSNQVVLGNTNVTSTILRGKVTIGDGTHVAGVLTATAPLDFPSTTASIVSDLTITVTGAALGDVVSIGVPLESITKTGSYSAWVSAANVVTIRFSPRKSVEDPDAGVFRAVVTKF